MTHYIKLHCTVLLENRQSTKQLTKKTRRAVAIKFGRTSSETNHEAYVTAQIYLAERAMATTEFLSKGKEEKIIAVMDFYNYSSTNSPPLLTLKETLSLLQAYYPNRLQTGIITEPAFWMRTLYNLIYPIMSENTRDKVQMAFGEVCFVVVAVVSNHGRLMSMCFLCGLFLKSIWIVVQFRAVISHYKCYRYALLTDT